MPAQRFKYAARVFLLAALFTICGASHAHATDEADARAFCSQLNTWLKDHGHDSWLRSNGDVNMNYRGHGYTINVRSHNTAGYYVILYNFEEMSSLDEQAAQKACLEAVRKWKFVRCFPLDNGQVVTEITGYFENVAQFEAIIFKNLETIESALKTFNEVYKSSK